MHNSIPLNSTARTFIAIAATFASLLMIALIKFAFPAELLFTTDINALNPPTYAAELRTCHITDTLYTFFWIIA